jgi:hypothetical protein
MSPHYLLAQKSGVGMAKAIEYKQELVKDGAQERNCIDAARFRPSSAPRSRNKPPMIRKIVATRTETT